MVAMGTSVRESYAHCQRLTRERAKNFYYAFVPLPLQQRRAIYASYAFCRQCDDFADDEIEVARKLELLAGHRRKLEECYRGSPQGAAFVALQDAATRFNIPMGYFDEIVRGVEMDLTIRRYDTFDDLYTYCYRVASAVGLVCIEIFGYSDPKAKQHAVDLGVAMQLTNILRDVKEDAQRDRVYLPLNEMQRFGYSEGDVFGGVTSEAFDNLMGFQVQRAKGYFEKGGQLMPLLPLRPRVCPAVLKGLYSEILKRIEVNHYNVYGGRISLSNKEKLWLTSRIWTTTFVQGLLSTRRS